MHSEYVCQGCSTSETPVQSPLLLPAAPSSIKAQTPSEELHTTKNPHCSPLPTLQISSVTAPILTEPQQYRLQSFRDLLDYCALMDLETKGCTFESFWLQDDECHRVVSDVWSTALNHPFSISKKLQLTTTALANWSRKKFSAAHHQLDFLKQQLQYHINQPKFETIAALLWQIWKARNHVIFRHQFTHPDQIVESALALTHLDPTGTGYGEGQYRWCFSHCRKLGCDFQYPSGSHRQIDRWFH